LCSRDTFTVDTHLQGSGGIWGYSGKEGDPDRLASEDKLDQPDHAHVGDPGRHGR